MSWPLSIPTTVRAEARHPVQHKAATDKPEGKDPCPPHPTDFEHAIHTANIWLKATSEALGTDDRHLAHRVLRTWLHTLRDRLTVDVAANFAAQLPELLRGIYYDGWDPSAVPVKYDREGYVNRFVQEAKVTAEEVPRIAPAVAAVVREHVSPGQLEAALNQLPHDIRALLLQPTA